MNLMKRKVQFGPVCSFSCIAISPLELLRHSRSIQKKQLIQVKEAKLQETEDPQSLSTLFPQAISDLSFRFPLKTPTNHLYHCSGDLPLTHGMGAESGDSLIPNSSRFMSDHELSDNKEDMLSKETA